MGHRSGIPFSPRGRMSHRGLTSGGGPCGATRRRTSRTQMQRIMHRSPGTNVLNGRTGNPDHRPDDHYGCWILDMLLWMISPFPWNPGCMRCALLWMIAELGWSSLVYFSGCWRSVTMDDCHFFISPAFWKLERASMVDATRAKPSHPNK